MKKHQSSETDQATEKPEPANLDHDYLAAILASKWWKEHGKYYDPDPYDQNWDGKRAILARWAFVEGARAERERSAKIKP